MNMGPDEEVVRWRLHTPRVAVVTMARPPANALGLPLLTGVHAAFDALEATSGVKVVIVESALSGFFAAGADIKHLAAIDAESFKAYGDKMRALNDRVASAKVVTIAAVDGLALGGGLELALACTFRVSGPGAGFGLPEVNLGLIPGAGGTQRLPRVVGRSRALDMMLTARHVRPGEAYAIGLVDRLGDSLALDAALKLADELVDASLPAQLACVQAIDAAYDMALPEGMAYEVELEQGLFEKGEAAEGIAAFIAKRPPKFD